MAGSGGDEQPGDAERALMDELVSERGRTDPQAVLRSSGIPGCRYDFVHDVLHDPRFVAPVVTPSADLMFQLLPRFMARLPPGRHRAARARFSGLFTPRRVDRYRGRIAARVDELIDALPPAGPSGTAGCPRRWKHSVRPLPGNAITRTSNVATQPSPTYWTTSTARLPSGPHIRRKTC